MKSQVRVLDDAGGEGQSDGMIPARSLEPLNCPTEGEVHCWRMCVPEMRDVKVDFFGALSTEEKAAAGRFFREGDRERYVISHGFLRLLLGRYLGCAPAAVEFFRGEFGKPELVLRNGFSNLTFNLTHSGDVVLVAIAAGRRVGVDVEQIRSERGVMEVAGSQFSREEVAFLESVAPAVRVEAFYRLWCLKEAYLKARGVGLSHPLGDFTVTIGNRETPVLSWAADDVRATERWSLFQLDCGVGYAGGLVCEGAGVVVRHFSHGAPTG